MIADTQTEAHLQPLTASEAEDYIAAACFRVGPVGAVGLEIERTVHRTGDPRQAVPVDEVEAVVGKLDPRLPGGGRITLEPGGQLELSSACAPDLATAIRAIRKDLAVIDREFVDAGLKFGDLGLDPVRAPVRTLDHPRYEAMERHFEREGTAGRTMMCSTASIQVCLEAGLPGHGTGSAVQRWERLHRLAPVLTAIFANSPFRRGAVTGWASTRQAVWLATDPSRTSPVPTAPEPAREWSRYALDASVLCISTASGPWDAPPGLTLRGWLRGEGPRPVTVEDLDYHLSTLFPYIRPRGFLEIRVIDAQPGPDWEVVTAITTALMDDERASDAAEEACEPLSALPDPMVTAARHALSDPLLATAGQACMEAALAGLGRLRADARTRSLAEAFAERYTLRGRCPADHHLERWKDSGDVHPFSEVSADKEHAG